MLRFRCPRCREKRVLQRADGLCRRCTKAAKAALETIQRANVKTVELKLGERRVLLLTRLDNMVRLASGDRIDRTAVRTLGSVCVPVAALPELFRTVKKLARRPA